MRTLLLAGVVCVSSVFCLASTVPAGCVSTGDSNSDEVFFQDSGSTNFAGFCYAVARSGKVVKKTGVKRIQRLQTQTAQPASQEATIPAALAEKLFSDIEAAMPLSALPVVRCAKSVSFGTSRVVWFKGEKSPDLCGTGNEKIAALKEDFANLMSAAKSQPAGSKP